MSAVAETRWRGRRPLRVVASGLSFVDCAGLAALLELACRAQADGVEFVVTAPSQALSRLSAYAQADQVLGLAAGAD